MIAVDSFLPGLYEDEGWMRHLSSDGVAAVIAGLETMLPPGAEIPAERASRIRAALVDLDARVGGGEDEAAGVADTLKTLEA